LISRAKEVVDCLKNPSP